MLKQLPGPRRGDAHPLEDGQLVLGARVGDVDLHQEAVALGLGQGVDALGLDGVLGREHQERLRQRVGRPPTLTWRSAIASSSADCTLAGARLISSASTRLAKTGTELGVEGLGRRTPHPGADDVARHQVGSELEAVEAAADDLGERADGEGLGHPGHALEEQVARASRPTSIRSIIRSWPTMTCLISNWRRSRRAATSAVSGPWGRGVRPAWARPSSS